MENLYDTREAARLLGLSDQTLRLWRCTGGGPAFIRVGRSIRYRESDLVEWLDRRRVNPASELCCSGSK